MLVATAHGTELTNLIKNPTLCDLEGGIQAGTLGDEEARRRRSQKTLLERAAEPTFPLAVEMHSRHRWLVHGDVASTVDLLLRGQTSRPQVRELDEDGQLPWRDRSPVPPVVPSAVAPRSPRRLAPVPLPDPLAPSRAPCPEGAVAPPPVSQLLRVCAVGLPQRHLEEAVRSRDLGVEVVAEPEQADVLLSLRGALGQDPDLRRQARARGLPILVIKSDTLHQLQRALERLLERRQVDALPLVEPDSGGPSLDDAHAGFEECRLAVEQVVLPQGRPVELLPRSDRVRQIQAELVERYRLRSAVFGRGQQQRLRVFPP
jgi:hypothetical protein